jgi:hypothetical protein
MPLTDKEKSIYNSYLIASRTIKNKPFKLRQDFSAIDDQVYITLKKLGLFFDKNSNIKQVDFFTAPFDYYGADNYFDLHFFITPKAIRCYSLYVKKKETQDPDNDNTVTNCKECCAFIYRYCKENNLTLHDYKNIINGTTPLVLQHLRDHKINFYTLHGLQCEKAIRQVEPDLLDFFISNFENLLNDTRINFQRSVRLKTVIREALSIIEKHLLKNKITSLQ